MTGVATIPLKPPDPVVRLALSTLDGIQHFVDFKTFSATMVSRLLGIPEKQVGPELDWLKAEGYIEQQGPAFSLTRKGKIYEHGGPSEEEGFHIVFSSYEDE